jgi:hypothetical protein
MKAWNSINLRSSLIFNVVTITGVASVALICYLRKRDNQKLAAELNLRQTRDRLHSDIVTVRTAPSASMPEQSAMHQDIRAYVARRVQDWTMATRQS